MKIFNLISLLTFLSFNSLAQVEIGPSITLNSYKGILSTDKELSESKLAFTVTYSFDIAYNYSNKIGFKGGVKYMKLGFSEKDFTPILGSDINPPIVSQQKSWIESKIYGNYIGIPFGAFYSLNLKKWHLRFFVEIMPMFKINEKGERNLFACETISTNSPIWETVYTFNQNITNLQTGVNLIRKINTESLINLELHTGISTNPILNINNSTLKQNSNLLNFGFSIGYRKIIFKATKEPKGQ